MVQNMCSVLDMHSEGLQRRIRSDMDKLQVIEVAQETFQSM